MDNTIKIRNISQLMQYSCLALAFLIIGFQLYFFVIIRINPDLIMPVIVDKRNAIAIAEAGPETYALAGLLYMLPSLLRSYGIWHLSRMFKLFKEGTYFSDQSISHLLWFSLIGFVTQLLASQLQSLAGAIARIGSESNFLNISITIDQQGIVQLLAWGTFLAIAWILREGIRIVNENAEFV